VIGINTLRPGTSKIGEILLLGVEEIIGQPGVNAVLNLGEPLLPGELREEESSLRIGYTNVTAIAEGMEKMYGPRGGRGVALRAGRAGFKYLLRQFGSTMGIIDLDYRMLPVPVRLKTGLQALANLMGQMGDEIVTIGEIDDYWTWTAERCPYCWQRKSEEPACHFPVGLLQEFFSWASSGRVYGIHEVECMAAGGSTCMIQINKKALD
jgi:predicted hydrocarbon binding protein